MPQAQVSKLEDLIPYQDSLTELWQDPSFQPVLVFLSSLYKQNVDSLLYSYSLADNAGVLKAVEQMTTAKVCNMIYNLPELVKGLKGEFEKQQAQKLKFINSQEGGRI